ncbi:hypothetical protein [Novilysobacter selenitireducens]|uniref:BZIP domain-containing protein n=1 Tax=Novilysobacter selenitireducens TaxID=2872639 RepID=A0ABS7T2I0_9GAMM|nr:hypothetical protein [Lysobacter selenitireducens]MBZ4038079.1 hypothetical protein [Lysobacter selenitireducens]
MSQPDFVGEAEMAFRDAFERLKLGKPSVLPSGTPVSQNNVAKEAGRDPSALRKSRYPRLIRSIQKWIEDNGNAPRKRTSSASLIRGARAKNRELKSRIEELTQQRDRAMARLVIAEESLLELHRRLQEYKSRVGEVDNLVRIPRERKASNTKS